MVSTPTLTRIVCAAAAVLTFAAPVHAQSAGGAYPVKTVRMVVPYPPGGGLDTLVRALSVQLSQQWGQAVVVDNKPGAGTLVGAETVAKAAPDGYTLMVTTDATITINPHLYSKLPYDPVKDFVPVTQLVFLNQLLLANSNVPATNLKELVAYAKTNPGKLNYASYGNGSQPHLAMEMLKGETGIEIVHVPYKGIPQAVPAAIANEVQLTFSGAASSMAHLKTGRRKALAIGGKTRLALLPDVPTFTEQGFPDIPSNAWFGLFAPAGTPANIVAKLHADIGRILKDKDFLQRQVMDKGYELVASRPEDFVAFITTDSNRNARAVKVSGVKGD